MKLRSSMLISHMQDYIIDRFIILGEMHGVTENNNITIYADDYDLPDSVKASMVGSHALTRFMSEYNDGKVKAIHSCIYIDCNDIMQSIIDYNMNLSDIERFYDVVVMHEIGHIIISFIGIILI